MSSVLRISLFLSKEVDFTTQLLRDYFLMTLKSMEHHKFIYLIDTFKNLHVKHDLHSGYTLANEIVCPLIKFSQLELMMERQKECKSVKLNVI